MSQSVNQSEPNFPAVVSSLQLNNPLRVRRPQGKALEILRAFTLDRQGEKCQLCPDPWTEIDHKDGNIGNNSPQNIRGLCKPCNLRQRNLTAKIGNGSTDLVSVCVPSVEPDAIAINREKEPMWIRFTTGECERLGRVERNQLRRDSSNYCNISPATHNRYLDKHISSQFGQFRIELDTEMGLTFVSLRKRPEK